MLFYAKHANDILLSNISSVMKKDTLTLFLHNNLYIDTLTLFLHSNLYIIVVFKFLYS